MDFAEVTKTLTILLVLSPLFLTIFCLAILLRRGFNKASKYSLFWLFFTAIMALAVIYQLINGITSSTFIGILAIGSGISAFLSLRSKKK